MIAADSTMVRPNLLAVRPTEESACFRLSKWRIFAISALVTITALFIANMGPNNGVPESEKKKLDMKPLSPRRSRKQPGVTAIDGECEAAVDRLVHSGIMLAAIDFDATILDIHTGGRWEGNERVLASHVRPEFKCYISRCLDNGIQVAVATFSTQTRMIARVLEEAIPHSRATDIVVFGGDDYVKGYSQGKQSQLFLAMESFNKQQAPSQGRVAPITPSATVLIDDDPVNIEVAMQDGYKTIHFLPDSPKMLLRAPLTQASLI
jgi:hypothetical protein